MKIQCNGCEAAEAAVLCCADEAALCWACDEKVHAANKLAGKHQRVPLFSPSRLPNCDICQEASGYFFCLEDRALFCRNCDVSIHTANSYVSAHRRFLVTGVQVGLEPTETLPSFAKEQSNSAQMVNEAPCKSNSAQMVNEAPCKSLPKGSSSMPFSAEANQVFSTQANKASYFGVTKESSYSGANIVASLPDWSVDDIFGLSDFNQNYEFQENGSSKADSGKLGSSDGSPSYFAADEGLDVQECWGQVPEISCNAVPEIPSPPTASGLHWHRKLHYNGAEHTAFVPEICSSPNLQGYHHVNPKRRRPY